MLKPPDTHRHQLSNALLAGILDSTADGLLVAAVLSEGGVPVAFGRKR